MPDQDPYYIRETAYAFEIRHRYGLGMTHWFPKNPEKAANSTLEALNRESNRSAYTRMRSRSGPYNPEG